MKLGLVKRGRCLFDYAAYAHSSVTISQRYVHPTPEALERAVERLEALNEKATQDLPGTLKPALTATVPATVETAEGLQVKQVF